MTKCMWMPRVERKSTLVMWKGFIPTIEKRMTTILTVIQLMARGLHPCAGRSQLLGTMQHCDGSDEPAKDLAPHRDNSFESLNHNWLFVSLLSILILLMESSTK
mmetsp:Transcript_16846/g.38908  ORF Transcript_16846/g.38908 Transcript_16846/m.38908 type:complete len:104 (+) Transcript_16846:727-1038(+)